MGSSFLQLYFETDSWLWPLIAIASLGAFWIYHRRVLMKLKEQQRELEENEHWLHEAQQIGNIGSWYRYLHTGKSRWSPQLRRIYGVDDEAKPSFDLFCEVVHPEDIAYVGSCIRRIEKTGETTVMNYRVQRKDGSVAYLENRVKGAFDEENRLIAIYGSVLDVTERKAYEDSLKRVIEKAESANRAKGTFLSMVSHEIRTPLNAIIGFSTLMAEQDLTHEQIKSYGESINAAGRSLSALISDILDLSALESLSFRLVPLKSDLRNIMEDVASVFKLIVSGKGISLNMVVGDNVPQVVIDGKRLRQIMINIIGNAIKFTEKGAVDVSVAVDSFHERKRDCDLVFKVKDTGIGISPIDQSRIFREFEQARGEVNRRFGGSGLGLSIVTQLLELMGGTIELESEVGRGSTFTVKFYNVPFAPASPEEEVHAVGDYAEAETAGFAAADLLNAAAVKAKSLRPLTLKRESLAQLRSVFSGRFALLAKGVNIQFARKLSTDVHSWSVKKDDPELIRFSEDFFRYTSSMNVGEMLKISNFIAGEEDAEPDRSE